MRDRIVCWTAASSCSTRKKQAWHIRISLILLLFCGALPALAAQVPDAPQPRLPLTDKILLGVVAAGRAGDAISTHQFLVAGQEEGSLPNWVACRQPNMWTYSMTVAAGQVQLSRLLIRYKHRRIARTVELIHAAVIWEAVIHNERILPGPKIRAQFQPNPCLFR